MSRDLLQELRNGASFSFGDKLSLIFRLSVPAILAQITSVIMQYIDASMVGRLGANDSAAIGLISSSTWLVGGLLGAVATGFTVQVAHRIGAGEEKDAREACYFGLVISLAFSIFCCCICLAISKNLPVWLGAGEEIRTQATDYYRIYALALPAQQMVIAAGGMLQNSGNMRVPSAINILQCMLNVLFNAFFIFPQVRVPFLGLVFSGLGLRVRGAALGTMAAQAVSAFLMLYFLLIRSDSLHLRKNEHTYFSKKTLQKATRISLPVAVESTISGSAYVVLTMIISPLGSASLAAHSFSVTAESLCYMPGYGIAAASTAIIGQSIGAGRKDMTKSLGWTATALGMSVMTVIGILMYYLAPQMIGFLTPDPQIRSLGITCLRIEAFAEPMFAASIVANGVFRGAGDTLAPSIMNLVSMWGVRLTLASFLAPRFGLRGVWIAMCVELCFRGLLFLARLARKKF